MMFCFRDIFVFLWNPQISKSVTSSYTLLHNGSYTFAYFFWILSSINMKFGRKLVYLMANAFHMFLAQCWRLETSSRPIYDFNEMTIKQDFSVFSSWCLPFFHLFLHIFPPYSPFQKMKYWRLEIIRYWVIGAGC